MLPNPELSKLKDPSASQLWATEVLGFFEDQVDAKITPILPDTLTSLPGSACLRELRGHGLRIVSISKEELLVSPILDEKDFPPVQK